MKFEELDDKTRECMLREFEDEESGGCPYRSKYLSPIGKKVFHDLMRTAIKGGDEKTLWQSLSKQSYWNTTMPASTKSGYKRIDLKSASKRLSLTEFNTWYTRGFARRLMEEKEEQCQVYRAETAPRQRQECTMYEGMLFNVKKIYDGHRKKYHPKINITAFSIPTGPNCHHTIRRVKT